MTTAPPLAPGSLRAALRATYVVFIGSGFAFASWASRIPQVRDRLELRPQQLGLVLLAIAVGSLLALPLSGPGTSRYGPRATLVAMSALVAVGLAVASVGYLTGVVPLVVGLFLLGVGNGGWDVAMNVHGADVERQLGRSVMSRFHAGFSIGTVAGALLGAGMVALHVPVTAHLLGVAALVAVAAPVAARAFLTHDAALHDAEPHAIDLHGTDLHAPDLHTTDLHAADLQAPELRAPGLSPVLDRPVGADPVAPRGPFAAWAEPRTLVIGVIVLAFAFAEGVGGDWIQVAAIDGYGARPVVAGLAFAAFLAAMTAGRWVGPDLLDRFGRVPVIRAQAALAIGGLLVFVLSPSVVFGVVGVLLWGLGTSLGFPVGMSAGADDPAHAAGRVSVIASIGYCAFLGGPPLIGFLGDRVGVLPALSLVGVLLLVPLALVGALQPPPSSS